MLKVIKKILKYFDFYLLFNFKFMYICTVNKIQKKLYT